MARDQPCVSFDAKLDSFHYQKAFTNKRHSAAI